MKGLVFTEFLDMVEQQFSANMVDDIIEASDLPSGGAYTAVGTYSHSEIVTLVQQLAIRTGIAVPELIKAFGHYFFGRFVALYPSFFTAAPDVFDFLDSIENHVHVEVLKLYPDAQLPTFETQREGSDKLIMIYRSKHPFATLAAGLIEGCLAHYQVTAHTEMVDCSAGKGTHVEFHITRMAA
ncbi:heme NO-binding domain-containing protein [Thiothrix subterranea]|uniref:Heme NO-binding domain-containing protein n=1 Tax=Thiothrix subterranea TaxID=2735563 RepID=A0AA51R452_9GAMM|nr:heme NO-binding domain-containing protein [Thiothrix subterranea]MDQ5769257.1 heme NO-binding domain-containing protein [Thiothrix subterranea]WML86240.1 heme NO-binding domain-containing protein [Thiothrix subterranea]